MTVTVTNVEELGMVSGDATVSYAENGTDAVATYAADGPDAMATWSVSGADMDDFDHRGRRDAHVQGVTQPRTRPTPTLTTSTR